MARTKKTNRAVTVPEIIIVVLISSIIMGVAMAMMSRNNIQFKKSNDLINIQRLMDNIVERIRSDVRSLKRVQKYEDNEITFDIIKGGAGATITYKFSKEEKTFYRIETLKTDTGENEVTSDFHGAKQILSLVFEPRFTDSEDDENDNNKGNCEGREFECLNVAMQIASNEYGGRSSNTSTLSIACQFYSTCVESELNISKYR